MTLTLQLQRHYAQIVVGCPYQVACTSHLTGAAQRAPCTQCPGSVELVAILATYPTKFSSFLPKFSHHCLPWGQEAASLFRILCCSFFLCPIGRFPLLCVKNRAPQILGCLSTQRPFPLEGDGDKCKQLFQRYSENEDGALRFSCNELKKSHESVNHSNNEYSRFFTSASCAVKYPTVTWLSILANLKFHYDLKDAGTALIRTSVAPALQKSSGIP